jgi:TetR/AcrR family transcriptional regulator, regulator of autoinduction and epiphytic fitness
VAMTPDAARADGRRLRREQNRASVIDALLALFRDGVYQPSTDEIAAKAGLSARSLFRYFDDVNDLHRAAADRAVQTALPLVGLGTDPDQPTADKIRAVVGSRVRLFEETGPAARALRAASTRRDMLRGILDRNRSYLRRQISDVFAPELAQVGSAVQPALYVLCSFESYELLRHAHGLSREEAEAALIAGIGVLLGVGCITPAVAPSGHAI